MYSCLRGPLPSLGGPTLLIASTPAHHAFGVLARPELKNSPVALSRTMWSSRKLDHGCGRGSYDNHQDEGKGVVEGIIGVKGKGKLSSHSRKAGPPAERC